MNLLALIRYRSAAGLRRAATAWSGAIMAVVVVGAIETPPPFGAWASSWGHATPAMRAAILIAVMAVFCAAARALLDSILCGEADIPLRLLPLSRMNRYALDWASAAMFLAAPIAALSLLAFFGDLAARKSPAIIVSTLGVSAAALVTTTAGALYARSGRLAAVVTAGALPLLAVAIGTPLAAMAGAAALSVPFALRLHIHEIPDIAQSHGTTRARTRPPRISGSLARLAVTEVAWVRRCAPSFASFFVLAVAPVCCAALAVRNNDVTSTMAVTRIWTMFASLAAGCIAYPLSRARIESIRFRAQEELLPIAQSHALVAAVLVAAGAVIPLGLIAAGLAPDTAAVVMTAATTLLLSAILRIDGEVAARSRRTTEAPFWLSVVFTALAMALHPAAGLAFLALLAALVAIATRTTSRFDFPRHAAEDLA